MEVYKKFDDICKVFSNSIMKNSVVVWILLVNYVNESLI